MDVPELPDLDGELRQLKAWTCMLDELQHTAAIVQMIQETTLPQVRFLMETLRQREIALNLVHDLTAGIRVCLSFVDKILTSSR